MTEIPEHLLKRSRERRSALGLGGDDAGSDSGAATPAAATPAKVESAAPTAPAGPAGRAAAPAPAAPAPPKPDTPVVAAYKRRKKIPFWAMAALGLMPLWALMYARAVTEQPEEAAGPLGMGAEVYDSAGCAGCHGPQGGGEGPGYAFAGGEVLQTFPHIEDQLRYVYFGTPEYNLAGVEVYGNPDREGGPHVAGALGVMPSFGESPGGSLADDEILAVVCHERYALGGADPAGDFAEEFESWCSAESEIFLALEGGSTLASLSDEFEDVAPMAEPIPGSPG